MAAGSEIRNYRPTLAAIVIIHHNVARLIAVVPYASRHSLGPKDSDKQVWATTARVAIDQKVVAVGLVWSGLVAKVD